MHHDITIRAYYTKLPVGSCWIWCLFDPPHGLWPITHVLPSGFETIAIILYVTVDGFENRFYWSSEIRTYQNIWGNIFWFHCATWCISTSKHTFSCKIMQNPSFPMGNPLWIYFHFMVNLPASDSIIPEPRTSGGGYQWGYHYHIGCTVTNLTNWWNKKQPRGIPLPPRGDPPILVSNQKRWCTLSFVVACYVWSRKSEILFAILQL